MRTRIGFALTLLLIFSKTSLCKADTFSVVQNQEYKVANKLIDVLIYKKDDSFLVENLDVILGDFHYMSDYSKWENKFFNGCVLSFKNTPLGYFSIPNSLSVTVCSDYEDTDGNSTGECEDQVEGELLVQLPYFPNGKYADIYDSFGKKVLTIDLSSKATCNENGKCDGLIEDGENCPQDCKADKPKIDPAVVQLAANNQEPVQEAEKKISVSDLGWWGIAILVILLAGTGIGYYVYRRNKIS